MLFKSLCCEIIMEHKESTSVKIMAISAEVFLTKKRVSLTIPVLKNGIIKGFCPIKTRLKAKVGKLF